MCIRSALTLAFDNAPVVLNTPADTYSQCRVGLAHTNAHRGIEIMTRECSTITGIALRLSGIPEESWCATTRVYSSPRYTFMSWGIELLVRFCDYYAGGDERFALRGVMRVMKYS
ncbi:hypothetical protein TSAR_013122 [Trichomalopsis sarcophagae]|uniref:Uncharacterized protein n=1 Tax=Trichomalopsis sarcophagae TaxID=543379 RepID=A0A232EPD4_9HYME|nr:hypothetical protein TSAR_013122 [Trichomalopsis sarcophagae]